VTRGDAHWRVDPPTPAAMVLGRVVTVTRDGSVAREVFRCTRVGRARGLVRGERLRLQRTLTGWLRWRRIRSIYRTT
jgi:hypothetical protein